LLLPNSLRSAVEARLAGFEEIAGYAGHARAWLLTTVVRPAPFVYERQHQQHFYRHLVSSAFGVPDESPKFPLLGSGRGVGAAKRLAVCPGAAYGPAKRWPAAYFAQVAAALRSQGGLEVVLLGAPGDREACAEVAAHLPNVVNKAGATSIAEFMDELRASSLVLCNDSGSMHLAAALGIPTAAIFGSTEPLRTGPLGPNAIALRHHVPCSPCFQRDCPLGDTRCLGNLQPADVIPACLGLMNS
jgi:heptosyltransferase-2